MFKSTFNYKARYYTLFIDHSEKIKKEGKQNKLLQNCPVSGMIGKVGGINREFRGVSGKFGGKTSKISGITPYPNRLYPK